MNLGQKKRTFVGIFFGITFLINILSWTVVYSTPLPEPLPPRNPAQYGTVPIISNGNTEALGYIDDDQISVHWFIHLTDIHVSENANNSYNRVIQEFLNYSYNYIHPFTLILTGDMSTGQHPPIYDHIEVGGDAYLEAINYFNIANNTPYATDPNPYRYLDITGNHDRNCDWGAQLFLNNSLIGTKLHTTQAFFRANFSHGSAIYSALDAGGPLMGLPVPFGSEGNLDQKDLSEYSEFLKLNADAEHKFTFEHVHPLETSGRIKVNYTPFWQSGLDLSQHYGVDSYFYGHTHMVFHETFGEMVIMMGDRFRDMYVNETTGQITGYNYRIIAVDGAGINYLSASYTEPTQIMITNPSNPLYLDSHDSIKNTRGDGNIRVLVFTPKIHLLNRVEYQIDSGAWMPMVRYRSASMLFESNRDTLAIPDDNKEHSVRVRAIFSDGTTYTQTAFSTDIPERKPYWQNILTIVFSSFMGIAVIVNRDNLPLRRADGSRRRLTHVEKVQKRVTRNERMQKPWWFAYLGWAVVITFFCIPWGILPIVHGAPAVVYAFQVIAVPESLFMLEALVYSAGILLLAFPFLYWGIRTYHPEAVNFGAFVVAANGGVLVYVAVRFFGLHGLILPAAYLYLIMGLTLMLGNLKNTFAVRMIRKLWQKKKTIQ